jgi:hypothetical protein
MLIKEQAIQFTLSGRWMESGQVNVVTSQNAKRTSGSLRIGCDLIPPGYPLAALLLSFPAYAGDDGTFMLSPRWGKSTTSVSNSVFI